MAEALVSDDQEVRRRCAEFLLRAAGPAQSKKLRAMATAAPRTLVTGPVVEQAGGPAVPLGCVTPRDLQDSPNLKPIGRLV